MNASQYTTDQLTKMALIMDLAEEFTVTAMSKGWTDSQTKEWLVSPAGQRMLQSKVNEVIANASQPQ